MYYKRYEYIKYVVKGKRKKKIKKGRKQFKEYYLTY